MTLCIAPWTSITVSAIGEIKPCCMFKGENKFNVHNGDTIKETWQKFDDVREKMLNGSYPKGCQSCERQSEVIGKSRKDWFDDKIKNKPSQYQMSPDLNLKHMDLNFGNTCNLRCRMCGSWGSSNWIKDEEKLAEINPVLVSQKIMYKSKNILADSWRNKKHIFENLERIDFKGGEPLMNKEIFKFLQYLIEWEYAKNITIGFVTNGTQTPEILKTIWPHFKSVRLTISVEGTGELYNYIRGESIQNLDQLRENILWFDQFNNISGGFNSAVQIYNVFDLNNLINWVHKTTAMTKHWYNEGFLNAVVDPPFLSIAHMPDHLKELAIGKMQNLPELDFIKQNLKLSQHDPEHWNLFLLYTKELDKLRGTDIRQIVPELAAEFK